MVWTVELPLLQPYWVGSTSTPTLSQIHFITKDSYILLTTGVRDIRCRSFSSLMGGGGGEGFTLCLYSYLLVLHMSVWLCVPTYLSGCVSCVHVYVYMSMWYICMHACVCVYVYVYMSMCICMHACLCVHVYVFVYMCICFFLCLCMHHCVSTYR